MSSLKTKILLVEDDPDLRETITEALAIHGFPVTAVSSGLDFYQILNREVFAVALVDLGLPDIDGYELVTYLRQNTSVKIVILSSREAVSDRVKGYYAGSDLYLTKPVNVEELAAAISSLAARGNGATEAAPSPWRLERLTWRLLSPDGGGCRLSPKEYPILAELAASQGFPVKRDAMLTVVYDQGTDTNSRALDAVIFRLRSRFRDETGKSLPLVTLPGIGYHFAAPLLVF